CSSYFARSVWRRFHVVNTLDVPDTEPFHKPVASQSARLAKAANSSWGDLAAGLRQFREMADLAH
ncbi:hypothetical protein ACCS67_34885, partial [Rhizobium brockwellii]|uniref:hypothetical protein n=1 Tax=Rhizobium brockwellii TaxID=3019932 RepID=UPI003F99D7D4